MNIKLYESFEKNARHIGFSKSLTNQYSNKLIDYSVKNLSPGIVEEAPNGNLIHYDVYTRLLKDRIIFLGHPIMDEVTNVVIAQLLFLEMTDSKKDITIYLNSGGGSTIAGKSLCDSISLISPDVSIVNVGMCASMGAVILTCGAKGKRFALKSSKTMVHEVSMGNMGGKTKDVGVNYQQMLDEEDSLFKLLSENTGQTYESIKEKCQKDYWMSAEQAKEEGYIDEILTKRKK